MKPTILFVDDEPHLLQGLRRGLRHMRGEWFMLFEEGGQQALDRLERTDIDVIVSDLRMPGMDGAELLAEVARREPHMIRIVLSGQSDEQDTFRLIGASHQFLAKPIDTDTLVDLIRRALTYRDRVSDRRLQTLASSLHVLPAVTDSYDGLLAELTSPEPSTRRVVEIISQDIALTARLLQVASSGYFGVHRSATSLPDALHALGFERITRIVLDHNLVGRRQSDSLDAEFLQRLTMHSVDCARLATEIAAIEEGEPDASGSAYIAGLLHDIGFLILATQHQNEIGVESCGPGREGLRHLEDERRNCGADHAAVGAYLAALWGLPEAIVRAIAYHHAPRDCPGRPPGVLTAVHVAEVLSQQPGDDPSEPDLQQVPDFEFLESIGAGERLARWIGAAQEAM